MTFKLISKLSIVIPTFNRQDYALRNMRFWSDLAASVYVMDGSEFPIHESMLKDIGSNVNYCHIPISLHERLSAATKMVATPYCIMLSDDEFFIPSALDVCISELESNPDLVACGGRCARFGVLEEGISGHIEYPGLENYSISQDLPFARITAHMAPYVPSTIYSVVRTDVWITAIQAATQMVVALDSFDELAFELVVSYSGKSKVIPELSWLRSSEVQPVKITHTAHQVRVTAKQWLDELTYELERAAFFSGISRLLSNDGLQIEAIAQELEEAVRVFERGNRRTFSLTNKIRKLFFSNMPPSVKNTLRPAAAWLSPGFRKHSLMGIAAELERVGVKVDIEEVSRINEIVREFHSIERGHSVTPSGQLED